MALRPSTALHLVDPDEPMPFAPIEVDIGEPEDGSQVEDGALVTKNPDGSATVDLDPRPAPKDNQFGDNLALVMNDDELGVIAQQLLDGIEADKQSRRDWMETRARGIQLLGLKLEEAQAEASFGPDGGGISKVRHPLLLEATVTFQALAGAELLPAAGPVKVRNDSIPKPPPADAPGPQPGIGHNGGPPLAPDVPSPAAAAMAPGTPMPGMPPAPPATPPGMAAPAPFAPAPPLSPTAPQPAMLEPPSADALAEAYQKDFNHYLTVDAPEYYPDTDRMLFAVGCGGDGFKKVFNCPLRRRPVSESVNAEDLIVNDATTDLKNCIRVTHQIKMRPSVLRRMQVLGAYRDFELPAPALQPEVSAVEREKAEVAGAQPQPQRPEDGNYLIYECYCELDLDEFAPEQFKGKKLPLPYKVTIEEQSRQVLEIRRNWVETDPQCLARQFFVQFPFIRGFGFYGLGYVHLLGNMTIALTAAYRMMLDNGMFANFPGGLIAKQATRQNSNHIRVPPGTLAPVDTGGFDDIRKAIMALPYKETGPAFMAFTKQMEENASRLAQTANIQVGEGKQDAPVGTTLALIEQATKVIGSVHKRLLQAQGVEFQLFAERFREDPEAFFRHRRDGDTPAMQWSRELVLKALDNYSLVPVADPNNPTSLHRIAKAVVLKELQKASPTLYDPYKVDKKVMSITGVDAQDTMNPVPANPPPDPRFEAIKTKAAAEERRNAVAEKLALIKAATAHDTLQDKAAERASREKIETLRLFNEYLDLQQSRIIHENDAQAEQQRAQTDLVMSIMERWIDKEMKGNEHLQKLAQGREQHDQRLEQQREQHEERLAQQREAKKERANAQAS